MAPPKNKGGKGKGKAIEETPPPPPPQQSNLVEFSRQELLNYGNEFTNNTALGDGLTSNVFKATIPANKKKGWHSKQIVAVKMIKQQQFELQFNMEKDILGEIKHPNIIKLVGYSYPLNVDDAYLLVYEYMPNGSLTDRISGLNWEQSIKVIKEVVSAINYLHSKSPPIIHRDLKPDNILFDKDFTTKLGDFGLAMRGSKGWPLGGTDGFSDPNVFKTVPVIKEFDIFSIGIIILELLVKRDLRGDDTFGIMKLPSWVSENKNNPKTIAGKLLSMSGTEKKVLKAVNLALKCLMKDVTKRPKISEILEFVEDLMN